MPPCFTSRSTQLHAKTLSPQLFTLSSDTITPVPCPQLTIFFIQEKLEWTSWKVATEFKRGKSKEYAPMSGRQTERVAGGGGGGGAIAGLVAFRSVYKPAWSFTILMSTCSFFLGRQERQSEQNGTAPQRSERTRTSSCSLQKLPFAWPGGQDTGRITTNTTEAAVWAFRWTII